MRLVSSGRSSILHLPGFQELYQLFPASELVIQAIKAIIAQLLASFDGPVLNVLLGLLMNTSQPMEDLDDIFYWHGLSLLSSVLVANAVITNILFLQAAVTALVRFSAVNTVFTLICLFSHSLSLPL